MYDLADGVSTANTNIESMAAKMWISYGAAWQLQNTLSAMGKTTADLNDIALNPTLRQQFKELQQYQKTQLQLPADFQTVNQQWAQSVQLPMDELKETGNYLKEMAGYDFEKILVTPFHDLLEITAPIAATLKVMVEDFNKVAGFAAILNQYSPLHVLAQSIEKSATFGSSSSGSGTVSSSASSPAMQVYNVPDYSSVAPNSPTNYYNSKTSGDVNYTSSPNITVNTTSDDPQGIASAVSGSMQANIDQAAIIKIMQGLQR